MTYLTLPGQELFCLRRVFLGSGAEDSRVYPEIPEVLLARNSLNREIPEFSASDWDHSITFLTAIDRVGTGSNGEC